LNWGIYQTKTDPLLSLATHDISIVIELAGEVSTVNQAEAWNYSNNVQNDRVWVAGNCNNVTFDIDVSWHWPVRTRQTIIIGSQGQINWNQDSNTITVTKNLVTNSRAIADVEPLFIEYSSEITPLEAELKHWVDCVTTRSQPTTGIESAKSVARVIDATKQLL
jgi:predicted dehydrogenase